MPWPHRPTQDVPPLGQGPQSVAQFVQLSLAAHVPSPQVGGHRPQSAAQLVHVSLPAQFPSPQMLAVQPAMGGLLQTPEHVSVVHASLSLQSAADLQHLATAACWHLLFAQLSVVQTSLSLHWLSALQQLGSGVCVQSPDAQASMVHASPSLQSASAVQHAVAGLVCVQTLAAHASTVQMLPSLQALSASQHSAILAWTHLPSAQVSPVHALPSSQPALSVHATIACHVQRFCAQLPAVAPVGSAQSLSAAQHAGFLPFGSMYKLYLQTPDKHLSEVQSLPSSQSLVPVQPQVPFACLGCTQKPLAQ